MLGNDGWPPLSLHALGGWKLLALATVLCVGSVASAQAQTDDDSSSIEELRAENRQVHADRVANAKGIDAANAEIEDLNEALGTFNDWINSQRVVVEISRAEAASAQEVRDEALFEVTVMSEEIDLLGEQIRKDAIRSFVGEGPAGVLLATGDPTAAIRQEALSMHLYATSDDLRSELDRARKDLIVSKQAVVVAAEAAETRRLQADQHYEELKADSAEYQALLVASEARLETLLFERQSLVELDQSVSAELSAAEASLADLLGDFSSGEGRGGTELISSDDIRDAGYGVEVHRDIEDNVRALLEAAQLDGVDLRGGGYRDSAAQIRVRRANCGSSDFAIYEMSPGQCRPPTARPGSSMHEQGKAIDFTYKGSIIGSRSGPGWEWLAANASSYGLFNLPSEPWHFSTNGA